jgi:S-formylglutathione hydrolase FrmB
MNGGPLLGRTVADVAFSAVGRISLLHGTLPRAIEVLAVGCGLGCLWRRDRRWWGVTLPVLLGVTVAAVAITVAVLRATRTVIDHYPPSFTVWVGLAVLTTVAAAAGFRRGGRWRRVAALGAAPSTFAAAFVLINAHYAYWPTVGDLLGQRLPDQAPSAALGKTPGPPSGFRRPAATSTSHGEVVPLDVPATVSHFPHRPGSIYVPPAFFSPRHAPLPVVVMLGGTPSAPDAWPRAGSAAATADEYAAAHGGIAPILAFVDQNGSFTGDSECVDGPSGNAETFLAVDVPRYLSTATGAALDPHRLTIAGFSEGGTCAIDLALRHPDVYGAFIDLAGDQAPTLGAPQQTLQHLYGGSEAAMVAHDPATLLRQRSTWGTVGWFGVGAGDRSHVSIAHRLADETRQAGITTSCFVLAGAHDWQFAATAFRAVLPQLMQTRHNLNGSVF